MRLPARSAFAVALVACALVAGRSAVAASPAPSFAADLSDDGACLFTVQGTWKNAKVDHVFALWSQDGGAPWATSEAPAGGPNGGTLKGKVATMQAGPLTSTTGTHSHQVLVQFYYQGAQIGSASSNTDVAACSI